MRKLFFICWMMIAANSGFAQQLLDKVVAVIENEVILQSELRQYALNIAFQMRIDPRREPERFEQLERETLQNLINQKILLAKAEEDSIQVEDRQVDSVLEEQINRMIQQVGSEQKLEEQLGMSISKLKRNFREEVRKNLRVEKLQQTKFAEIKISRREVEELYHAMKDSLPELKETVDISHILISIKPGNTSEQLARQKITELLKRVKDGEDFAELCRKYSEDPGSAARGGEIGFMERGDFVPEFEEVAFLLEPGQFSDIVKSRYGFHIIQCLDRKGDKINVRHLLIRLEPTNVDEVETEKRAQEIRAMLNDPANDFAALAKQYSDDESTRDQGGHLGLFETENLQLAEFKTVIDTLKPGAISQPFKTKYGWHIVKLNSKQEPRPIDLRTDWERIEAFALNIKRQKQFQKWLEEIKKDVYVEVKLD
ncbi:MAG: peptidylprolyl isomerase [candidate division KSB1 bacterium]|nr:peptidylprolyl isomerase [candidate division KSB1 bacterium]MDZ7335282.1 peptidylprolyl isomerase [candidate division KSB1 bacterium]MDZ7358659.1 peptidylprolyl isomerase [candidate division KSB1 bacterium]MDZ7399819.1 peptidylprolyl isomerase [candidate division KSB1 bacterium]